MSNEVTTLVAAEFTAVRTINKIERELTETNLLFSGKKVERNQVAEAKILDQWNEGYFVSLMATFAGALGPIVQEKIKDAASRMNDAEMLGGKVGTHNADKPNRVMVVLALGLIINALEDKQEASRKKAIKAGKTPQPMKGETLRFHGIAVDLTAKYKALVVERAAKAEAAKAEAAKAEAAKAEAAKIAA